MQEIVAPATNREFGLLENSQNVLLLLASIFSFRLFRLPGTVLIKLIYLLVFIASVFTFLEEIDYGHHFWAYYKTGEQSAVNYNVHNIGNTNNQLRFAFYLLVACFVLVMPFLPRLPTEIRRFSAPKKMILTVFVLFVVAGLAAFLKQQVGIGYEKSLKGNVSEFEEFCLYYLLFVYVYVMYAKESAKLNSLQKLPKPSV
jgi:hypothetical protein